MDQASAGAGAVGLRITEEMYRPQPPFTPAESEPMPTFTQARYAQFKHIECQNPTGPEDPAIYDVSLGSTSRKSITLRTKSAGYWKWAPWFESGSSMSSAFSRCW